MTAYQKAGKAPSQTLSVHVNTSRMGMGRLELGFMCNSSVRCLELQLLPSSGAASQGSLSPHSMAFPEYLLTEAAMRHLNTLARSGGQAKALLSSYVL